MKKLRFFLRVCVVMLFVLMVIAPVTGQENKTVSPAPVTGFKIQDIEGWMVYIDKQNLAEHPSDMKKIIDLMKYQFYQIRLVVPKAAVEIMQERVPLWLDYDSGPGMAFHPSYKWLLSHGYRSPEGLTSLVGNCEGKKFLRFSLHQPWDILHEMAHGYDFLYLGVGKHYSSRRIAAAFRKAEKSGKYDSVLCRYSKGTKHYAMSNRMEYFAESTEAYFGTNDFYPFVRAELKEYDPDFYSLLQDMWGVDAMRQAWTAQSLARFIETGKSGWRKGEVKKPGSYTPTAKYQKRQVEGWTVYVDPGLVKKKAYGDEMCKLLGYKLYLVKRYMPEKAIEYLKKVPVWLEEDSPEVAYMTYHASAEKLKAAGQNPAKLHCIEIGNTRNFSRWQNLQQFMVLNQLARAYFDLVLKGNAPGLDAIFKKSCKNGKYDSVLRFDGKHVRHPGLKNPLEFFAEMTESYYGVNDCYPFLQFELRQHDPAVCKLLAKLWGGKSK